MLVPLYGFVEGDCMGLLVLAREGMLIEEVGRRLKEAARTRVDRDGPVALSARGKTLLGHLTVLESGLCALDRIDLRFVEPESA